jgi:hypothetical protein
VTFCLAVTLVAFGSCWYHYAPTTDSLVWDRLPMAAGFMALLALVLGERVSWSLERRLLWPLVIGHSIKHFVSSVAVLFAIFAMLEMKVPDASPEVPAARRPAHP